MVTCPGRLQTAVCFAGAAEGDQVGVQQQLRGRTRPDHPCTDCSHCPAPGSCAFRVPSYRHTQYQGFQLRATRQRQPTARHWRRLGSTPGICICSPTHKTVVHRTVCIAELKNPSAIFPLGWRPLEVLNGWCVRVLDDCFSNAGWWRFRQTENPVYRLGRPVAGQWVDWKLTLSEEYFCSTHMTIWLQYSCPSDQKKKEKRREKKKKEKGKKKSS